MFAKLSREPGDLPSRKPTLPGGSTGSRGILVRGETGRRSAGEHREFTSMTDRLPATIDRTDIIGRHRQLTYQVCRLIGSAASSKTQPDPVILQTQHKSASRGVALAGFIGVLQ